VPTFKKVLEVNETYAIDNGKEPSAIKQLLMHHGPLTPTEYYLKKDEAMDEKAYTAFLKDVDEYIKHDVPIQHLIGHEVFYGYSFKVTKDVLIPRFETEELVTHTLDYIESFFPHDKPLRVADVGTGSGCIGLTLKKERASLSVTCTDVSKKAVTVAQENAEALGIHATFAEGNMCEPLGEFDKFDIIVSNPPYLKDQEPLEAVVKNHEPHVALFGGSDGLKYYRELFETAESYLNTPYMIAMEHGFDTAKAIRKLIQKTLKDVTVVQKKDMQGKDRMTFVFKKP